MKFLLSFIALFSCAFSQTYQQTWNFKNDPQEVAHFLESIGISEDFFYQVLDSKQIQVVHGASCEPLTFVEFAPEETLQDAGYSHLVWEDDWTWVYIPARARVANHMWVVLKKEKQCFLDVSDEEAFYLNQTLKKVLGVLYSEFGYSQYVIAQFNRAEKDHFTNRVTIEVIPPGPDAKEILDFEDKIACNSYCVIRGNASAKYTSFSEEEMSLLVERWKDALQRPTLSDMSVLPEIKIATHKNQNKKIAYLVDELFLSLNRRGILIDRQIHNQDRLHVGNECVHRTVGECAFCSPDILGRQKIFEKDGVIVLYNHMPFVEGAHFLIIPSQHRSHFQDLSEEERAAIHKMTQKLIQALQDKYGRTDIKMYIQEGASVGQTIKQHLVCKI